MRELQTTVSYLKYHFNQRDLFDRRIQAQRAFANNIGQDIMNAPAGGDAQPPGGERRLLQQANIASH